MSEEGQVCTPRALVRDHGLSLCHEAFPWASWMILDESSPTPHTHISYLLQLRRSRQLLECYSQHMGLFSERQPMPPAQGPAEQAFTVWTIGNSSDPSSSSGSEASPARE